MIELTGRSFSCCDGVDRRSFLRVGFLGLWPLRHGTYSGTSRPSRHLSAQHIGHLRRAGRWPTQLTNHPKPQAPAEYRGPRGAIDATLPEFSSASQCPSRPRSWTSWPSSARFITTATPTTRRVIWCKRATTRQRGKNGVYAMTQRALRMPHRVLRYTHQWIDHIRTSENPLGPLSVQNAASCLPPADHWSWATIGFVVWKCNVGIPL